MTAADDAYAEAQRRIARERASSKGFLVLTGLTALRHLPPEISELTQLRYLFLDDTTVCDLAPIAPLVSLEYLNLDRTQVLDLTPISAMTSLASLSLRTTPILNFDPLASLTSMWSLDLSGSKILDLRVISKMKGLTRLYLADTHIADISPLSELTNLHGLDLRNSQVADLRPVLALSRLTTPGLFGDGLYFGGTVATRVDRTIRQIAAFGDPPHQAQKLFAYLKDWVPPRGKHPTPRSFKQG
jgi:Leucine-rich repeat (LRR) protein